MINNISPFVASNKDWIIRNSIAGYLRAKNMFNNYYRELQSGRTISFEDLKKLTEILKGVKDELHLIFNQLIDPKTRTFEKATKLIPNEDELLFINNVGVLFHKAMVVRELKYVMEHYQQESEEYVDTSDSFETYIVKIDKLFQKGINTIKDLLIYHADNVQILTFFVENDRYVEDAFNEPITSLLEYALGNGDADTAYVRVGKYFVESGWHDRARKWLQEAIRINPDNNEAQNMLDQLVL